MKFFALLMVLLLIAMPAMVMPAMAVQPDEMLKDPALEARAREISRNLRCLVCQGEDIDESNATLAGDIRRLVRERLKAGDSDDAVLNFIHDRYGDYVLMTPPFRPATWLLWLAPLAALAAGGIAAGRYIRAQSKQPSEG